MKLAQISLHSYRLPYRNPVRWSDTEESHASYVLLRVVDEAGAIGYAEATPKPTWSGYTPALLVATLQTLFLPLLRDCDVDAPAELAERLQRIPGHAQARGLVESALWQLRRPPAPERAVRVSCTLTRDAPVAMARKAAELAERHGLDAFKLKGGQGVETDLGAVRELRHAVPGARITVDCNSAYEPRDLGAYSAALAGLGIDLLEDPCAFDLAAFAGLAPQSRVPLLVDLAAADAALAAHFAASGAAAISAKPGRYGLPEALRVADAARRAGKRTCLGLYGESDLGSVLNLSVTDGLDGADVAAPAELSFFLDLAQPVLQRPLAVSGGAVRLPTGRLGDADIDFSRMQTHASV